MRFRNPRLMAAVLYASLAAALAQPCQSSAAPRTASFQHIVLVLEENENSASVIGDVSAPYFNLLANTYGYAANYFANTHPSIGNYLWLTTGQQLTNDDSETPASFPVSVDNVVRHLIAAGVSWKAYAECMPNVGYIGGDTTCTNGQNYYVRHVPLEYITDVQNDAAQRDNLVPFEDPTVGFAHDVANNTLPGYSFVTPNGCNDGHDCSIATADTWLQNNIEPLINNASVMRTTLVIILFDESATDNTNGGGKVYWTAIGPQVNPGYVSNALYQHQSTLRQSLEGLGVPFGVGAAATAPSMAEFFKTFELGARVVAPAAVNVTARPNLLGHAICTETAGSLGTVEAGPRNRSGSLLWYLVYDDGCAGWSAQAALALD